MHGKAESKVIALFPAPLDVVKGSWGRLLSLRRSVDSNARSGSPRRDPELHGKLSRSSGIDHKPNLARKGIGGVLRDLDVHSPAHHGGNHAWGVRHGSKSLIRSRHPQAGRELRP